MLTASFHLVGAAVFFIGFVHIRVVTTGTIIVKKVLKFQQKNRHDYSVKTELNGYPNLLGIFLIQNITKIMGVFY